MIIDQRSFQRLVAAAAIVSAPLAFGNIALGAAAIGYAVDVRAVLDPAAATPIGATDAGLLRWSMICDLFGYYLLLAPLALLLGHLLRPKRPGMVQLYTWCGLAYTLVGAIGAAVFAAVAPPLIADYGQAATPRRELLEVVYTSFANAVVNGLWNPLEMILGSVWWLGIGLAVRGELPWLGLLTIVVGICALLDAAGRIFAVTAIFAIGLAGVLLLIPIWALCFGLALLRHPVLLPPSAEVT
jgi:Domain of unknown function (DUF4386)